MKTLLRWTTYILIGGASYWVPDILMHAISPAAPPILLLTLITPFVVIQVWLKLKESTEHGKYRKAFSLMMLLGIWFFAPICAAIGMDLSGGTLFSEPQTLLWIWLAFPLTTVMMSTYSGSLGGIFLRRSSCS